MMFIKVSHLCHKMTSSIGLLAYHPEEPCITNCCFRSLEPILDFLVEVVLSEGGGCQNHKSWRAWRWGDRKPSSPSESEVMVEELSYFYLLFMNPLFHFSWAKYQMTVLQLGIWLDGCDNIADIEKLTGNQLSHITHGHEAKTLGLWIIVRHWQEIQYPNMLSTEDPVALEEEFLRKIPPN